MQKGPAGLSSEVKRDLLDARDHAQLVKRAKPGQRGEGRANGSPGQPPRISRASRLNPGAEDLIEQSPCAARRLAGARGCTAAAEPGLIDGAVRRCSCLL